MRTALFFALALVASQAAAEPVKLDELAAFYAKQKADGLEPRPPRLAFGDRMKIGHVGVIPAGPRPGDKSPFFVCRVLQVLPENSALVAVRSFAWRPVLSSNDATARVLGDKPAETGSTVVLVRGIDTEGLVDGKSIELSGAWRVAEATSYETATGSRTVFALEPIELPEPGEASPRE